MFSYRIILSRRRTISVSVSPDKGVVVRAPLRTSQATIERFILERSAWIEKHLGNFSTKISLTFRGSDGEIVLYRGTELKIQLAEGKKDEIIPDLSAGILIITCRKKENVIQQLNKWYLKNAEAVLRKRVAELAEEFASYGFIPSSVSVRKMKRRWGSCNISGKITLNSELIKLSEKYSDYVILHELCHLKHHNHGSGYYNLLAEVYPDYKEVRKELRSYLS